MESPKQENEHLISQQPMQDEDHGEELEIMHKMAISGILALFHRFDPLEALRVIREGIDHKRFPLVVRPKMESLRWEIDRSHKSRSSFLVYRITHDLRAYLTEYTDEESSRMLSGLYTQSEELQTTHKKGLEWKLREISG